MTLAGSAQYICIGVYCLVSLFGAILAWTKRSTLKGLNRAKELLAADGGTSSTDNLPGSFSRTVGLAGAIGLAGFMWCIGFLLLAGSPIVGTQGWSTSLQQYVLACAALFAPYAFNRLAQVFPQGGAAAAGPRTVTVAQGSNTAAPRGPSPKPVPKPAGLIGD